MSDILFFIKFGKKEHLEQIITGKLRFSPSQDYINLEEKQHQKGQGDLLEGKMKIKCNNLKMRDPQTNELIRQINTPSTITMSIQDVNNIPVFCLTAGNKSNCINYIDDSNYTIFFSDEQRSNIRNDFPDADSALVILQPELFINDVCASLPCIGDSISYYDYDGYLTVQMLQRLLGVDVLSGKSHSLLYENRYRHLFCKDVSFSHQQEYRFLMPNETIEAPETYDFVFNANYLLMSIRELFNSPQISS